MMMKAEARFYAELLPGITSNLLTLVGVAILYLNMVLFQDYLVSLVSTFVLAQALRKGREVVFTCLVRLDKDGREKELLVTKAERMAGELFSHLTSSHVVDTVKSYSLLLLPILGSALLLMRLIGPLPFLSVLIVGAVGVHMALSRLDRRFFDYRKYLSDDSMASLLTMLVCAVSLGSLAVFLLGGSVLECAEAGRRVSAFMKTTVVNDANKAALLKVVDEGTQQVMAQVTPYLDNATIALTENRERFGEEWWWPTVDQVATSLLDGTKAAATGNTSDVNAEALYQVVVGSCRNVNVTEFMASVNTTAIMEMLDMGALAGKAANAGVSIADLLVKVMASLASLMAVVVGGLLSLINVFSFLGSLFYFLCHPRLLTRLLDDLFPISKHTQHGISDTLQASIERVLLLPLKLASSHGIVTLLTFSLLSVDFAFLATSLSILLTLVPLLPPKLSCLPWSLALLVSFRSFVPLLPGIDFLCVPAPLKGVLLLAAHITIMDKVDERLFALPHDGSSSSSSSSSGRQGLLTSVAFVLGYQKFGYAGVLVGPGILCLGELFYSLLKNLKATVVQNEDHDDDGGQPQPTRPVVPSRVQQRPPAISLAHGDLQ